MTYRNDATKETTLMPRQPRKKPSASGRVRLQKFLSDAGVTSRRHAEQYILDGRVMVNDQIVDTIPAFIDPKNDVVRFNGSVVRTQTHEYFILNKPKGVVCSQRDPAGRPRAVDLLPRLDARLFPVGRLDVETTGLLLLTNDGELTEQLTHPRYGLPKVYRVEVKGEAAGDLSQQLRKGVYLADGRARASEVVVTFRSRQRSVLEITLREGRNRQVRRMLARFGHPVKSLKRIRIGPLEMKGLAPGACRALSGKELEALREALAANAKTSTPRPRKSPGAGLRRPRTRAATSSPDAASRPGASRRTATGKTSSGRVATGKLASRKATTRKAAPPTPKPATRRRAPAPEPAINPRRRIVS
jgi:23S rRNA pseudouridine2605 synthase